MWEERYALFNHADAFAAGAARGLSYSAGGLRLDGDAEGGLWLSPVLDSRERGNAWQRLLAETDCPEGARVVFHLFASDRRHEAEARAVLPAAGAQPRWTRTLSATRDALLTGVRGRWLVAGVELSRRPGGEGPVLSSLQLFSARESFLRYLPELFRQEDGFLDRFLKLLLEPYLELEARIDALPRRFDPRVAPGEVLYLLAEWMGVGCAGLWEPEGLRRLLLACTPARRGTLRGLRELVEHYTGHAPYPVECFRMTCGIAEADDLYRGGGLLLLLPPGSAREAETRAALQLLVEDYLPAGLPCRLIALDDAALLSRHTYLGVNARVSEYRPAALAGEGKLHYVVLEEATP